MRQPRGFNGSATHLTAPPFPAASRPSNSTTSLLPVALIQYCSFTNSMCSAPSLASYALRLSLPSIGDSSEVAAFCAALFTFFPTVFPSNDMIYPYFDELGPVVKRAHVCFSLDRAAVVLLHSVPATVMDDR